MEWRERIVTNPDVMVGKPVIKGTRITMEFIIDLLGFCCKPLGSRIKSVEDSRKPGAFL